MDVGYASYRFTSFDIMEDRYGNDYKDDIEIVSKKESEDFILIQLKNNSNQKIDFLNYHVLFYDNNNNIIGFTTRSESDIAKGATVTSKSYYATDAKYNDLKYAKYEIVIASASVAKK